MTATAATRPSRSLYRLLTVFVAVIGLLTGLAGTASASAASPARPSSGVASFLVSKTRVGGAADLAPLFVGLGRSVSPGQVGQTCPSFLTIVSGSCVATNTTKPSLGDDFVKALDDIDSGAARPNVRNPKPFTNDGRGGTTRLPGNDAGGSPVIYTEHTVNARPPGGTLDGKRIVTGSDGSVWATSNHFETWTRVR